MKKEKPLWKNLYSFICIPMSFYHEKDFLCLTAVFITTIIKSYHYLQFVQPIISSIDKALFQILTSVMSPECSEQSELLSAHRPTYMMSKKFEGTFTFFKRSSTKSIFVTWPSLEKNVLLTFFLYLTSTFLCQQFT